MTETKISRLIPGLAVPTVISMMVAMIYNVADTFFVSKISIQASGATGIVFTLMGIIQAVGFTFGHGAGSNISRQLGAKDFSSAKKYSSTAFYYALIFGILIAVFGIIFITPFMKLIGSTDTILPYAVTYARYILIASPAFTTSCVMNNILRYEGKAGFAMIGLATGGILNMLIDPIFIFVFKMGIAGAGLATALSQYISMGILMYMFISGKAQSTLSPKYFTFKFKVVYDIVSTGIPSFARQGLNSISTMVLNITAAEYGDSCIAAMSIVAKCSMIIFSVGVGIGQGFQPVCSFNYGAKKYNRVRKSIAFTLIFDTIVCSIISAILFISAPYVIRLFREETTIVNIGTSALRYMCISMVFLSIIILGNMTFQSTGKTGRAFFLACSQNGLFFIPLILILSHFFGLTGIEIAQSCAYVLASAVSAPFLFSFAKSLKYKE